MATDEPILTISVASGLVKLHPRTLMLYEASGLISPHRTTSKRRMYSASDLKQIQFVKYLTRNKGVNLSGVKIILEAIKVAENEGINLKKIIFPFFKPKHLI